VSFDLAFTSKLKKSVLVQGKESFGEDLQGSLVQAAEQPIGRTLLRVSSPRTATVSRCISF
jgi:hypothetical protein